MDKKIKKKAILGFQVLCALVLIGVISDWVFNFSDEINQILSIAMFSLIGIAYLAFAFVPESKILKFILGICGIFLIAMNFFGESNLLSILTIICVLIPMLIGKFLPEEEEIPDSVLD